jgi:hypothetical protein
MEATAAKTEGMAAMQVSDFVYEAIKGVGKVGGYLNNILADTMFGQQGFSGRNKQRGGEDYDYKPPEKRCCHR